jgi:hypothetical protein
MTRVLLVLALALSLWPAGVIAVGAASDSPDTASSPTDSPESESGAATTSGGDDNRGVATDNGNAASTPTPSGAVATSSDGKTFSCSVLVLGSIDAAAAKAKREKATAARLDRSIRRIERDYPGKTAPAGVADRFNSLVHQYNVRVRRANAAVDGYNRLLRQKCSRQ